MFKSLDEKVKKLNTLDMSLVKLSAMVFGILFVKVFPEILSLDYWVLVLLILLLGAKPLFVTWFKK